MTFPWSILIFHDYEMRKNPAFLEAYFLNDEENVSSFEPAQIFGPNIEIPGLSHDLQHFSYNHNFSRLGECINL